MTPPEQASHSRPRRRHGADAAGDQHRVERVQTASPQRFTELIIRIGLRDSGAFSTLYDRVSASLFAVILRRVDDREVAESLLEEGFLNIWRKAPGFRPEDDTVIWLLLQLPTATTGTSGGGR